jgi:hypothetical protein
MWRMSQSAVGRVNRRLWLGCRMIQANRERAECLRPGRRGSQAVTNGIQDRRRGVDDAQRLLRFRG